MDILVLDTNLDVVSVLDVYKSIIWVERYYECGDFEIYTGMTDDLLNYIKNDNYLQIRGSDTGMIIEDIRIETNAEDGNIATITGRSFESLLSRRVVWTQTDIDGKLQNGIKKLLDENLIAPSKEARKIPNFIFKESTDPRITELTLKAQYTGDNLYDVVTKVCEEKNIGFRVTLNESKQFVFELYAGEDRSYDQIEMPYVVFSPNFDNILNSNYFESKTSYKNVALIGGQGEGTSRKYFVIGNTSGIERRELFVDARDISNTNDQGGTISDSEYNELLKQRGNEYLSENKEIVTFEGEVESTIMYKYGVDFFIGDVVQVENEYGHKAKSRILEIVVSENEEGRSIYPTFKTVDPNVVEEDPNTVLLIHGEEIMDSSMYSQTIINNGVVVSDAQSKFGGKGLYFDGATTYMTIKSDLFDFKGGDFTFDWWEYCLPNLNSASRLSLSINSGSGGITAGGGNDANGLYVGSSGTSWDMIGGLKAFDKTPNEWVHWALVRSNGTICTFRNGVLYWSSPINGSIYWNGTGLVIGSFLYDVNHYFGGYIDEFRVSNIARWTEAFTPPDQPYDNILK